MLSLKAACFCIGANLYQHKAIHSKISTFPLDLFSMIVKMCFIEFLFKIIPIEVPR